MALEAALFPGATCRICHQDVTEQRVKLRDGSTSFLISCSSCNFTFFDVDTTPLLESNKLDDLRLAKAGLEVPDVTNDFRNGKQQALEYVSEFLPDSHEDILEVGCSWGYFLQAVDEHGSRPTGIEINPTRRQYVCDNLGLPCFASIHDVPSKQFDKIFLFYVLEYFPNPLSELQKLSEKLNPGGELIAITPNHDDVLLTIWQNTAYQEFVYDACAVNYFTPESLEILCSDIAGTTSSVYTHQGYSFANHLHWHLTGRPMQTGCVGKDRVMEELWQKFSNQQQLAELIRQFDLKYRQFCSQNGTGNQIHLRLIRD